MISKQIIENGLHDAMRQHDDIAKDTLRILLSSIKLSEIDKGVLLDETAIINILSKEIKIRKESILEFSNGNRKDLVEKAEKEISVLEKYQPAQMSDDDLKKEVLAVITEVSAASSSDLGKVMKILVPKLAGKASADRISAIARGLLV
jgi:uncharacterized protein YqeY